MISTHILDTTLGAPASDVEVHLEKQNGDAWIKVDTQKTNNDGRIVFNDDVSSGTYRLSFMIEKYFESKKTESFFSNIPVIFKITNTNRKYHVPILLNPFGYSTYRGS
jgi:5-hydroxyisourate hydrolase